MISKGMIIAILGKASGGGREFEVFDYCFASFPEQPKLPKGKWV